MEEGRESNEVDEEYGSDKVDEEDEPQDFKPVRIIVIIIYLSPYQQWSTNL